MTRPFARLLPIPILVVLVALLALAGGCKKARKPAPKPVIALTYALDDEDCREERLTRIGEDLRQQLLARWRQQGKLPEGSAAGDVIRMTVDREVLTFTLRGARTQDTADVRSAAAQAKLLAGDKPELALATPGARPGTVEIRLTPAGAEALAHTSRQVILRAFRRRLEALGVTHGNVRQIERAIVVELPHLAPGQLRQVKQNLNRRAHLTFHIVDETAPVMPRIARLLLQLKDPAARADLPDALHKIFLAPGPAPAGGGAELGARWRALAQVSARKEADQRGDRMIQEVFLFCPPAARHVVAAFFEELQRHPGLADYRLPADRQLTFGALDARPSRGKAERREPRLRTWLLHRAASVTGQDIVDARPDRTAQGYAVVAFRLGAPGERRFRTLTRQHIDHKLAIVLDGRVLSAPIIRSEIGAQGQIALGSSRAPAAEAEEARSLAALLRSGSLGCAAATLAREQTLR